MRAADGDTGHRVLLFQHRGLWRTPIARAISWQTRSAYAHAAVLLPDWTCVESVAGKGTRRRPFLPEEFNHVDPYAVEGMTAEQWAAAEDWWLSHLGYGYDYAAIARFLSRKDHLENGRFFCSEYVFDGFLATAFAPLLARIPASHVAPAHLRLSPFLKYKLPTTPSP